jgi:AcrR family transcriptional regulator
LPTNRKYELKERAERMRETRRRITEAAVELHRTVGPAATQVSEVARRAGVQRVTLYNHFPDQAALLGACSAHWRALHPAPDAGTWREIEDSGLRTREALRQLYGWYRETEPMTANVLRDAETVPALHRVLEGGLLRYLDSVATDLAEPFRVRGRRHTAVACAARAVIDFHFWRCLSPIGDVAAADLGASLLERAAGEQ